MARAGLLVDVATQQFAVLGENRAERIDDSEHADGRRAELADSTALAAAVRDEALGAELTDRGRASGAARADWISSRFGGSERRGTQTLIGINQGIAPQKVVNDRARYKGDAFDVGLFPLCQDFAGDAGTDLEPVERTTGKKQRINARIAAEQSRAATARVNLAYRALREVEYRATGRTFPVFGRSDVYARKLECDAIIDDEGY